MKPKAACVAILAAGTLTSLASTALAEDGPAYRWKKFVAVEGQPEPVPAEWVSTPEGRFAHSIRIPNPVPKDSGYRPGMSPKEYFDLLCEREAGEFIFTNAEDVQGLLFMRPPRRPTDNDLMDRYKLEAPDIERTFQLVQPTAQERGKIFVNPPWRLYTFVEEPLDPPDSMSAFARVSGYQQKKSAMMIERLPRADSRYGLTWRGIRRVHDRESTIAGSEWIVIDRSTDAPMAVLRDYVRTGHTRGASEGIWWLNAVNCPNSSTRNIRSKRIYDFSARVLKPRIGELK